MPIPVLLSLLTLFCGFYWKCASWNSAQMINLVFLKCSLFKNQTATFWEITMQFSVCSAGCQGVLDVGQRKIKSLKQSQNIKIYTIASYLVLKSCEIILWTFKWELILHIEVCLRCWKVGNSTAYVKKCCMNHCGSRGSYVKSNKLPQMMSRESASFRVEDYFEKCRLD